MLNIKNPASFSIVITFYFLGSTSSLAMEDVIDDVTHSYFRLKKTDLSYPYFIDEDLFLKGSTLFIDKQVKNVSKAFGWLKFQFTKPSPFSYKIFKTTGHFPEKNFFFNYAYSQGFTDENSSLKNNKFSKGHSSKKRGVVDIEELKKDLDQVDKILGSAKISNAVTVIIGNTGAGKTTIFRNIQGLPIKVYYDEGRREYLFEGEGISSGYQSKTTLPTLSLNGDYFDCPGFGDNRGIVQDIINAYSLYKLFNRVKEFNLLVVVSASEFQTRAEPFITLIDHIEKLFPDERDIEKLKKGFNLVVSHVPKEKRDTVFIKKIMHAIVKDRPNLSPFKKEIIKFLADENNEKITFFEKPEKNGTIKTKQIFIKDKSYIKDIKPSISVADKTEIFIKDLADETADDISIFFNEFKDEIPTHTHNFVRTSLKTAPEIRNNLKIISHKLNAITSKIENLAEDKENIKTIFKIFNTTAWEKFSALMERREFLGLIKPENTMLNLNLDQRTLKLIAKEFSSLGSDPEIRSSPTKNKAKIKGPIIGTSDIQKEIKLKNVSKLEAWGLNSLIIDGDITAPGTSIALISPFWVVIGDKTISLKGRDGSLSEPQASLGKDGRPGKPGQCGGNFYGFMNEFYNSKNLTIEISGGKGGNGQDGGNGREGTDGKIEDVLNRVKGTLYSTSSYEANLEAEQQPSAYRKVYRSGGQGEKGGNAGTGGIGGQPGLVFLYTLEGKKVTSNIKIRAMLGASGRPGIPGKGGKHGKVFEGVYIEKNPLAPNRTSEFVKEAAITTGATGILGGGIGAGLAALAIATGPVGWVALIGAGVGAAVGPVITTVRRSLSVPSGYTGPDQWESPVKLVPLSLFAQNGLISSDFQKLPQKSKDIEIEKILYQWREFIAKTY